MARPAVRFACFVFFATAVSAGAAQEVPATPVKPAGEPIAQTERAVSPHVADLLAAATPHFAVTKPVEKKAEPAPDPVAAKPANVIMRLPNFVVREPRIPSEEDMRTPRGLELYAMTKYLGRADGFSRGVLNHFTIADAWKNTVKYVPILNRFEWASSPEKTAVDMYYDDEVRKKMADLYGLLAIAPKPAASPAPAPTSGAGPDGK